MGDAYPGHKTDEADRSTIAHGGRGLHDCARSADLKDVIDTPAVRLQQCASTYASTY